MALSEARCSFVVPLCSSCSRGISLTSTSVIKVHGPLNSQCVGSSKPPKYVSDQPTATLLCCTLGYDALGSTASIIPLAQSAPSPMSSSTGTPRPMPARQTPWPWPLLLPLMPPRAWPHLSASASVSTSVSAFPYCYPAFIYSYPPTRSQGCQDTWAKTFTACLSVVTQDPTNLLLWAKLLMLPKCILASPGADHRLPWREILQHVRSRLRR